MISSLKIRTKLWLLIGFSLVFLVGEAFYALMVERDSLMQARRMKTHNTIELAYSVLDHFGQQVAAGQMDQATAQEAAKATIGALRYDGENYFSTYDLNYHMVKHPLKPEMNGKDMSGHQGCKRGADRGRAGGCGQAQQGRVCGLSVA